MIAMADHPTAASRAAPAPSAPPPLPYPVSECTSTFGCAEAPVEPRPAGFFHMTVTTPSPSTSRLVEARQRADISREDIAKAIASLGQGHETIPALAQEFLSTRQTIHRFCAAVRAIDSTVVDRAADLLCNMQVSADTAQRAQQAMAIARQKARGDWQRQAADDDKRFVR